MASTSTGTRSAVSAASAENDEVITRWSMWMAVYSANGTSTYSPGPATRLKRPKRSTVTRSHCGATRMQQAHTRPAATAATTVHTDSHGSVAANTMPNPSANITNANRYTPARVASFGSSSVDATERRSSSLTFDVFDFSLLRLNFIPYPSNVSSRLSTRATMSARGTPSSRHC